MKSARPSVQTQQKITLASQLHQAILVDRLDVAIARGTNNKIVFPEPPCLIASVVVFRCSSLTASPDLFGKQPRDCVIQVTSHRRYDVRSLDQHRDVMNEHDQHRHAEH